jgi:hypothetical protein
VHFQFEWVFMMFNKNLIRIRFLKIIPIILTVLLLAALNIPVLSVTIEGTGDLVVAEHYIAKDTSFRLGGVPGSQSHHSFLTPSVHSYTPHTWF